MTRLAGPAVAAALSLMTGACGMSFPMASLFPEPESTSSITPRVMSPLSPELGGEDWRRAKGALAIALDPQGSGSSVSWDNPDTDMKGNFAPVGQPFVKTDGQGDDHVPAGHRLPPVGRRMGGHGREALAEAGLIASPACGRWKTTLQPGNTPPIYLKPFRNPRSPGSRSAHARPL